jgi:hypothetical protein
VSFFPAAVLVPETLRTSDFLVRPLGAADTAIDYAAYMASPDVIRAHSGGRWPTDTFTMAENQRLAERHEQDHRARRNFTFLVLTPDETTSLGCVYFLPLVPFLQRVAASRALIDQFAETSAMIPFWVRQAHQHSGLTAHVVAAIHNWVSEKWPFADHVFRVCHAESASIRALEQSGLQVRFDLAIVEPPHQYHFFGQAAL